MTIYYDKWSEIGLSLCEHFDTVAKLITEKYEMFTTDATIKYLNAAGPVIFTLVKQFMKFHGNVHNF